MAKFHEAVEAVRITFAEWDGSGWDGDPFSDEPDWLKDPRISISLSPDKTKYLGWQIMVWNGASEAAMLAAPGDWIIRTGSGRLSAMPDDVFRKSYEAN